MNELRSPIHASVDSCLEYKKGPIPPTKNQIKSKEPRPKLQYGGSRPVSEDVKSRSPVSDDVKSRSPVTEDIKSPSPDSDDVKSRPVS